jgi:anti-sigma regulatory factor (Ser/Thr protein kinase)
MGANAGQEQAMVSQRTVGEQGNLGRLELPDDNTAPGLARSHTRAVLGRWSLPGVLEPLLLVVSELVSNAVRHGRPPVGLWLRRVGRGVRVDVHDESSEFDAGRAGDSVRRDLDAEGGRGLSLIDALSVDHGVDQILHDGKHVWAVVEPEAEASVLV